MVGVDVGLENPRHLEGLGFDMRKQGIRRAGTGVACGIIEVEHGIDDRALAGLRVAHQVREGVAVFVEEALDLGAL